jgi:hypothetical protein
LTDKLTAAAFFCHQSFCQSFLLLCIPASAGRNQELDSGQEHLRTGKFFLRYFPVFKVSCQSLRIARKRWPFAASFRGFRPQWDRA